MKRRALQKQAPLHKQLMVVLMVSAFVTAQINCGTPETGPTEISEEHQVDSPALSVSVTRLSGPPGEPYVDQVAFSIDEGSPTLQGTFNVVQGSTSFQDAIELDSVELDHIWEQSQAEYDEATNSVRVHLPGELGAVGPVTLSNLAYDEGTDRLTARIEAGGSVQELAINDVTSAIVDEMGLDSTAPDERFVETSDDERDQRFLQSQVGRALMAAANADPGAIERLLTALGGAVEACLKSPACKRLILRILRLAVTGLWIGIAIVVVTCAVQLGLLVWCQQQGRTGSMSVRPTFWPPFVECTYSCGGAET
jgi:hypothetical protein